MSDSAGSTDAARRHAFAELVEPQIEVLLRVARSLAGNAPDAEDLVQKALLRAFRGLDVFDGRHPRAWLLTILRNTNANLHRRQRPLIVDNWELIHTSRPAFGAAVQPSAEDSVVADQIDTTLWEAVSALDPRFRTALILVDLNDLSYAEAAAVLGVPVGTVMSRLSRARERVRRAVRPTPPIGEQHS